MRTISNPDKAGRHRALRLYPDLQPCEVCGKTGTGRGSVDRHHRNSVRLDNSPENIAFLCRRHHHAAHRLSDGKVGGGPRPRIAAMFRAEAIARATDAARLAASGKTTAEIAKAMRVDPWTVLRWFRKYPTP